MQKELLQDFDLVGETVDRLTAAYHASCADTKREGLAWYPVAHAICNEVATLHGLPVSVVAGIVSALSPSVDWGLNVSQAIALIRDPEHAVVSTYGTNRRKAVHILSLARHGNVDHEVQACFSEHTKTWAFYRNMLQPEVSQDVTLDRHMYRVMWPHIDVRSLKPTQYFVAADIVRRAARPLRLAPSQLQAIAWVRVRKTGNLDGRQGELFAVLPNGQRIF